MKIVGAFALLVLAACAGVPTLEELEDQAMLTGNWAAVEKRERAIARRQPMAGVQCPAGHILFCEDRFGELACGCMERSGYRIIMTGR